MDRPDIQKFILNKVHAHPSDIIALAMDQFEVTQQAVSKHMKQLIEDKLIHKEGKTKGAQYKLIISSVIKKSIPINESTSEDEIWMNSMAPHFKNVSQNISDICSYGFTEMFNNIIDHSGSKIAHIQLEETKDSFKIKLEDEGAGVFSHLREYLNLKTEQEVLIHLNKGKLTSDPSKHSGEGLFFTSRTFDTFSLSAGHLKYARENNINDWYLEQLENRIQGTHVELSINKNSNKILNDIFMSYSDDDYKFNKSEPLVKLALLTGESYISRSQGKRLVLGLEKFDEITFDFDKVRTVGQAFVDQVFRVWHNQHPNIKLDYINANESVTFMIERGLT